MKNSNEIDTGNRSQDVGLRDSFGSDIGNKNQETGLRDSCGNKD